jgi:hypothetical protein
MAKGKKTKNVGRSVGASAIHEYISASIDPFHPGSKNVKLHDGNNANTLPLQLRTTRTINQNSAGMMAVSVRPLIHETVKAVNNADPAYLPTTGITSASAGFLLFDMADYATVTNHIERYRVVSWGVRMYTVGPSLDVSGEVKIHMTSETLLQVSTNLEAYQEETHVVPIQPGMDVTIVPPNNAEEQERFIPFDLTPTQLEPDNALEYSHRVVNFLISGLPTGTTIKYEIIMNLECLVSLSSITRRLATPAAPHDIGLKQITYNAKGAVPSVSATKTWWKTVKNVAAEAINLGSHLLGGKKNAKALALRTAYYIGGRLMNNYSAGYVNSGTPVIEVD